MIQATLIGTGTAFSRRFGNTNTLVEGGEAALMIDFGFTTPARLETLGRTLKDITHVAISHIHADHVGGLEELAFLTRFALDHRVCLVLPRDLAGELWSSTLRGGLEMTSDDDGKPMTCTLETYFDVILLDDDFVDIGGLEIKAFNNDHVPGKLSYGFVVRTGIKEAMIFGCDVRQRISELEQDPLHEAFAHGPIFHDCQLFDDGPAGVHIPLEQLMFYPQAVRDRLVLVHYNDSILDNMNRIRRLGLRVAWPSDVIKVPGWKECVDHNQRRGPRPIR